MYVQAETKEFADALVLLNSIWIFLDDIWWYHKVIYDHIGPYLANFYWVNLFSSCSFLGFLIPFELLWSHVGTMDLSMMPGENAKTPLKKGMAGLAGCCGMMSLVEFWIVMFKHVQTCSITLKCVSCSLLILSYLPLYLFIWLYKMLHPADLVQPSSFFYWHGHFINRLSISVHYASQSARIIQNQICGYLGLWNVFPQALDTHSNLTGAICIL